MAPAARIGYSERDRLFGRPCQPHLLQPAELFGVRVLIHYAIWDRTVNAFIAAHRAIVAAGAGDTAPKRVDSYVCRAIRGVLRTSWDHANYSLHAYGLAFDVFRTPPGVPPPGGVWTPTDRLHPAFVATMEHAGFTWGGRWSRKDEPHFEWAGRP